MNYCQSCIMPDTRPDTEFVDGECSACVAYRKRQEIDWNDRAAQLVELIESFKEIGNQDYDCIVPSSGGKDSHYQVLRIRALGFNPLVVTAQTCHETELGRRNIDNLAKYADTVVYHHRGDVRAKLNRIGLEQVGDISWPEHVAIFTVPFRAAVQLNIPLIFYGENPQNQYGGPMSSTQALEMTARWRSEFGGFLGLRPSDMVGQYAITEQDMLMYQMPGGMELGYVGVQAHFLGQYFQWDSWHNAEMAISAGMQTQLPSTSNYWQFENLDNAQTGIHDHMMWRKYGYTRAQAQLSVDIRTGKIDRGTALAIYRDINRGLPAEYMGVPIVKILERLKITPGEYYKLADEFTNWDIMRRVMDDSSAEPILLEPPGSNDARQR